MSFVMRARKPQVPAPMLAAPPAPLPLPAPAGGREWRVLVVDSDPDVHAAFRLALEGRALFGRPLVFLYARSGTQARALLRREKDLAVVVLDAVTDGTGAGLDLVDFIRHTAGLRDSRIVLRTGRPGQAPDLDTLLRYDINDCRTKNELTPDRLLAIVVTAVRSYEQLCAIEANRRSLELMVRSSAALLEETNLHAFARGVIIQLASLLGVASEGLVCSEGSHPGEPYRVLAATGPFARLVGQPIATVLASRGLHLLRQALKARRNIYGPQHGVALYIGRGDEQDMAVFIDAPASPSTLDRQLLEVFCANLRTLLHNRGLLERLHQSAYFDPLVCLPNRAHFVEKVDECVWRGTPQHVLALLDIDDFSATNDVMGHRFGDRLLEAMARRLATALPQGLLLARVGSDTFGILGPTHEKELAQLLDSARQPLDVDGVPHKVSLTCGYVRLPRAHQAGTDLVKDATIALKRAKRDHRGQLLEYSEHMGTEARDRALLLSDLRAAIDGAQLFLVYQPQVDLESHALVGLEALLRWRKPDGNFVPPDRFIPVAEHSGLIIPLGQWVLATACRTMRELLDAGHAPRRMAVNVSTVQLQDPGFLQTVQQALMRHGLRGAQLELEITESVAVLPTQLLQTTLSALRALGVTIAIDDFGTGYSSLSYLERLPLDRIKIDRSFVRRLGEAQGARIAEMVAQLGRKLGLQVLAEGIEDAGVWQALRAMGCQEGQGYHIARPMDKGQLQQWLPQQAGAGGPACAMNLQSPSCIFARR
ncbi:Bacteriophytochrome cph2 [Delftia tsuruhatensis]|uniref:putative bifunctional diguanylate cyclase/phosphodiesterase n=1 Tax=Delftia tsuruhatensis TaxID=180282 RepID=UPI001E7CE179|nr:EAL domain-containing protein [Delftia tsuruhatensis]CAB5717454.1 Bacteriophytochrome cph2 [Delftia tsuruhatensis]CAC9686354.1 Bacteriophytochrome cph2 [Delftia tsuruhatensis]